MTTVQYGWLERDYVEMFFLGDEKMKLLGLGDSIKYKGKEYDVKGFTRTSDGYCVRLEREGAKLLVSLDKIERALNV